MIPVSELKAILARELAIIADAARRRALEAILIEPGIRTRAWDYGEEGEGYDYWVVAEAPEKGIELAYYEQGFGPEFPWGFLFTDEDSLGMDSQWNWYLEEAFIRSGLSTGPTGSVDEEAFHLSPEERFPGMPHPRRPYLVDEVDGGPAMPVAYPSGVVCRPSTTYPVR